MSVNRRTIHPQAGSRQTLRSASPAVNGKEFAICDWLLNRLVPLLAMSDYVQRALSHNLPVAMTELVVGTIDGTITIVADSELENSIQ